MLLEGRLCRTYAKSVGSSGLLAMCLCVGVRLHTHRERDVYVYIHIYIKRERETEREREPFWLKSREMGDPPPRAPRGLSRTPTPFLRQDAPSPPVQDRMPQNHVGRTTLCAR